MRKTKSSPPCFAVFSELWDSLGRIPPDRIRLQPPIGTATEADVVTAKSRYGRTCELIDGTLVAKAIGWYEARVASLVGMWIDRHAETEDLGITFGGSGPMRVGPGQIRMPDVAFFSWSHFPGRILPTGQILDRVPDLAVEVLSPSNTKGEMERKRREYFLGGCQLVWEIDPVKKSARAYTAPDEYKRIGEKGALGGGPVLPGFRLALAELFARAGHRPD